MQLATRLEQRLGPQDVRAAGERAVGVAGWMAPHDLGNALRHHRLSLGRKAPVRTRRCEAVPAEVDYRRAGERREDAAVEVQQLADEPQLSPRRCQRAVVALVAVGRLPERRTGAVHVTEQQPGLAHRGGGVIVIRRVTDDLERSLGPLPGQRAVPGHERQRRRIDERVVAAGPREDVAVQLGRPCRLPGPRRTVAAERAVLGDPGAERGDVLVVVRRVAQAVDLKMASGLFGRARAGKHEHGPVLQADVVWMLSESALGQVECGQQLAAALLTAHLLQPPSCCLCLRRPAHGSIVRSAHGRDSSPTRPSMPPRTAASARERSDQRGGPRRETGNRDRAVR